MLFVQLAKKGPAGRRGGHKNVQAKANFLSMNLMGREDVGLSNTPYVSPLRRNKAFLISNSERPFYYDCQEKRE